MKPLWDNYPHFIRMQQLSGESLEKIIQHAIDFEKALKKCKPLPRQSRNFPWRMRVLFYEPSTRTHTTFKDAAALFQLSVDDVPDPGVFSSAVKGEKLESALAAYTCTGNMGHLRSADIVVLRHKASGASQVLAKVIETAQRNFPGSLPLPVINAGDGTGQHPTQALVDLATISAERKNSGHSLDALTILFSGDLARSRVVNSLLYALGKFGHKCKIRVMFCIPNGFGTKPDLLEYLARNRVQYEFGSPREFPKMIKRADIVYMTRVQRERKDPGEVVFKKKCRRKLVFRKEYVALLKQDAFVMHPLPINEDPTDPPPEIDSELWPLAQAGDPRFAWMRQSHRGISVRAALLDLICLSLDAAADALPDGAEIWGRPWKKPSM